MRQSFLALGLVGTVVGGVAPLANGQSYFPSEQNITMGEWVLTPVLAESSGVRTVEAFLALRDYATLVGDNIGSVLYVRGAGFAGGWGSFGWESQDQWAAIEWVKHEYSIGSTFDDCWQTTQTPPQTSATPEEPESFDNGVLDSDPLAPIAAPTPEWDALVELLVEAG